MKRIATVILAWGLLLSGTALESRAADPEPSEGIIVTADSMEMDEAKQITTFSGKVHVVDGALQLSAGRMAIHYGKDKLGKLRINEIKLETGVVIVQDKSRGTADRAVFKAAANTIELIGTTKKAVVEQEGDRLEGERITLILGPDRRITKVLAAAGQTGRVSARIVSGGPQ